MDVSRPLDDLISDAYQSSPIMSLMLADLTNPEARQWHRDISSTLKIPFAECRAVAGRVYSRDRLVLPPDNEFLHLQVLHRTHNAGPSGHPGRVGTIHLLNRSYWWPNMTMAARKFCQGFQRYSDKN